MWWRWNLVGITWHEEAKVLSSSARTSAQHSYVENERSRKTRGADERSNDSLRLPSSPSLALHPPTSSYSNQLNCDIRLPHANRQSALQQHNCDIRLSTPNASLGFFILGMRGETTNASFYGHNNYYQ